MAYSIITLRGALKEMGVARAEADYSEKPDKADKSNIRRRLIVA